MSRLNPPGDQNFIAWLADELRCNVLQLSISQPSSTEAARQVVPILLLSIKILDVLSEFHIVPHGSVDIEYQGLRYG